jgi:4-amino-4-deoxy-L-arabinose transferase-like glycosyltransferase
MSCLRCAVGIFLLTISVRGFLLSRTSSLDFLYVWRSFSPRSASAGAEAPQTEASFLSGDEGINVAISLSQTKKFADPFIQPTGPTAHVPPLFPLVTSYVFRMAGYGNAAAAVRNGLNILGLGLLYASFPFAARALGVAAASGGIAGILAAIFPAFRSSEVFRGRDEWAAALVLLWLTALTYKMCTRAEARFVDTVVFGLGWGLLLHIQPSMVAVLPVHGLILLVYRARIPMKQRLGQGMVAASIVLLVLLPWTIRNYFALGAWMFVRDNFGLELRVSHGDGAQPSQAANGRTGWLCAIHPTCSVAAANEVRRVGEVSFNRQRLHEALAWISGHPGRVSILTLARVSAFWADLPSNWSTFAVRLLWSLLGWLGLIRMWKAEYRLQAWLFGSVLVFYPLIYYAVQYSNRYVIAICFAIFLPAGFALHQMYLDLRSNAKGAFWPRT